MAPASISDNLPADGTMASNKPGPVRSMQLVADVGIICTHDALRTVIDAKLQATGRTVNLGLHAGWAGVFAGKNIAVAYPPDDARLVYAATRQLAHIYGASRFLFVGAVFALQETGRAGDLGTISSAGKCQYPAFFENASLDKSSDSTLKASQFEMLADPEECSKGLQVLGGVVAEHGLQKQAQTWKAGAVEPWPWHPLQFQKLRQDYQLDVCSQSATGFFEAASVQNLAGSMAMGIVTGGIASAVAEEYRHRETIFLRTAWQAIQKLL